METNVNEIWQDIAGYEGLYQISSLGRIKSIQFKRHIIRKPQHCRKGYLRIQLGFGRNGDGTKKSFAVHRLVAAAFIPNPESKLEVNHKNSIRDDNRADNLEWSTHSENQAHAYTHGNRCHKGDNHPQKVLNSEIVKEIRALPKKFGMVPKLAEKYGVSRSAIHSIINYKNWKNII